MQNFTKASLNHPLHPNNGTVEEPLALNFRFSNPFYEWPTWKYPTFYDVYCTNNYTIPGERHPIIGAFFIAQYLVFLSISTPALIVISRPPLIDYSCYKLMLVMGVLDNITSLGASFFAGVFSIIGANYCDNTMLLIVLGHIVHSVWYFYCGTGVLLAFNRYIEMRSPQLANRLFSGRRLWLWLLPPAGYGIVLSTSIDLPIIYNSVWSVYLFQIDVNEKAPPITNWLCVANSVWVMTALVTFYALLLREMRKKNRVIAVMARLVIQKNVERRNSGREHLQSMVFLQCFLICFFLFLVLSIYAASSFLPLHLPTAIFVTVTVQICAGFTSVVYLLFNSAIRDGVKKLLCGWNQMPETIGIGNVFGMPEQVDKAEHF